MDTLTAMTFAFREFVQDFGAWIAGIPTTCPLAFAVVALAGLIMSVTPSTLPLVPVVIGFVVGRRGEPARPVTKTRALALSVAFVLGMATVDAAIGALFGLLGYYVVMTISSYLDLTNLLIAALLVFLGLALLRKVRVPLPTARPRLRRADSLPAAYLLGIPFGLSVCPACTPLVLPVLGAAAATGVPWVAAALLFTFGLGRGVTVVVAGTAAGALASVERSARWVPAVERIGGVLLLLAAVFFLYQSAMYAGYVPPLGLLF
jgi:cytochrome c-type biogenesis protein